jgi:hypothetical protein
MRFTALLFTMALTGGIHGMAAQGLVGAGQRVRITSAPHGLNRTVGRVITATADTMTVAVDRGATHDTLVLALADLQRLELARSGRRTLQGARIGASVGITIGYFAGVSSYGECVPQVTLDCLGYPMTASDQGFVWGCLGAGAGAIVGALLGTTMRREKWEDVTFRQPAISVRPLRGGGLGMGLALHF